MTERPRIRRRAPTAEEKVRISKAIREEATPEAIEATRELGKFMLKQKQVAAAATAELLRGLLEEKERQKLSLADLAATTGIGRSNLSRLWNQQEPGVTLETVERIAEALKLKVVLVPRESVSR
jgi:DNA-binding Xre family transcriptional regulator